MTMVIKGEFKKLESLKISDVSLTCNTSLEIFNKEFNRMSRMDDDLFTYEVEIAKVTSIPCYLKKEDDSEQQMSHKFDDDMEYDPSDARGYDEVELADEESSDSKDENEVSKFFRIKTNVFDFETPLCRAFKNINYLLQIDPDVLTNDIERFKTYKDYKDDWIYEWNKDNGQPVARGTMDIVMEETYHIVGNALPYQDFEWYESLKDGKLKKEALKNKAIMKGIIVKIMSQLMKIKRICACTSLKTTKEQDSIRRLSVASSVRRPLNRDSPLKNSVLSNTKKSSEKVEVSVMTNKKTYVASKNIVSNKKIVTDVDVKNALKAKDVFQIVLWIADSGCSKHMTGLGHNLFSVGQFCDADLEVAFRSNTCYVQNLERDDLLTGAREFNLYTISISDMVASSPVYLLSKATSTKSWLWHRKLTSKLRKPNVDYFHVFGSLCYPTNDREDLGKMKPKADIGIFIGYYETSKGFQIYNRCTKNIMETIHVKFDELTIMASEHDSLEPISQRFINNDSSAESMNTPSKEDLDNLFGPMYDKYFEKRSSDISIKSATHQVHNYEDSPLTSSIIIEEHEAPPIVTTSEEQTSPISLNEADEFNQESLYDDATKERNVTSYSWETKRVKERILQVYQIPLRVLCLRNLKMRNVQ
ncbi:hypothetical protein Tco_0271381 [Tanacetum coccineum]